MRYVAQRIGHGGVAADVDRLVHVADEQQLGIRQVQALPGLQQVDVALARRDLRDADHAELRIGVALPFGAITVFLTTIAMRARAAKVVTGDQGMIGMIGIAKSPLTPQGKVFVNGELWNAVALAPVKTGQPVRVRSVHGLTVEVEPETTPSPTT